jgi:ribosomal protein S18 acetylase RimI-like enzyme
MSSLRFAPIDFEKDAEICVLFRRDSYFCSFGEGEAFEATGGAVGYLELLRERHALLPEGIVHVWRNDHIIGQIEAQLPSNAPGGYVNLFHLVPEERDRGTGALLQEYVVSLFTRRGVSSLRLSVSPTNARAMRFYAKHGWRDLGPRPDYVRVHLMELCVGVGCEQGAVDGGYQSDISGVTGHRSAGGSHRLAPP